MALPNNNPFPIPTSTTRPQPNKAIMLEVTLKNNSPNFEFRYNRYWEKTLSGPDKHNDFLNWILTFFSPTPPSGVLMTRFDSTPNLRKPSKMSFKCKDIVYLAFKLDPALNWRFTADGAPISMDKFWETKNVFFNVKNFDEAGKETIPSRNNAYKYAYMIVDSPKGTPGGSGTPIEARFNLHVDFVEDPANDDSPYVPVILDPDVRNPGGNAP